MAHRSSVAHSCARAVALVLLLLVVPARAQSPLVFQQRLPGPSASSLFGRVAVDGLFAAVGAPGENSTRGAVYIFEQVNGTWTQRQRLTASDGLSNDYFGYAVAMSGDTLAIGAHQHDAGVNNRGAVYVFVRANGSWVQQTKLLASDAQNGDVLGERVSISGHLIVASATGVDQPGQGNAGAAYVFERSNGAWSERKLQLPDGVSSDNFGGGVDVSGNSLCIGAPQRRVAGARTGAAYVYLRSAPGMWTLQQMITPPAGVTSSFGNCSIDADTLAVGSADIIAQTPGLVSVYVRSGAAWTLQQSFSSSDGAVSFGRGGGLTLFGNRIIAADPGYASARGRAFVFERVGSTWTERQVIEGTALFVNDNFGDSIATDGQTLMIGASNFFSASTTSPGSVHVFRSASGPDTPGAPANFAASVTGNTVAMSWAAPAVGGAPTGYTIRARSAPGGPVLAALPVGTATSFSVVAPNGTFVLSALATNGSGAGPESLPVTVIVPQATAAPGAPSGLTVAVMGSTLTFSWAAPASGGAPTAHVLLAGLTPGFTSPFATVPLPASPRSLSVPGVPPGTYYVRVVAQNSGGTSAPSNEVSATVAAATAPGAPTLAAPVVAGSAVQLSWTPGPGGAPAAYTLYATVTPGGTPIATVPLTATGLTAPGVPSGTYYLRVTATNGAGTSAPSNQVTLVVP